MDPERHPPLLIDLPPMTDDSAGALHGFLAALLAAFELHHELQLWRYYGQLPEQDRPARFTGEPF